MRPKIAVLYAPGTNCHEETAFAIECAGGDPSMVILHDLLAGEEKLSDYQGLVIPGGFSFGDHIVGGRILATYLVARLNDELQAFVDSGKPVLGICNGDQVLMESGILPTGRIGERVAALAQNRMARFESRWANLLVPSTGSFWTEGFEGTILRLPVAHSEGRLYHTPGTEIRPAFLYADGQGMPTESYPANPAGSPGGVAGVLDPRGTVLGLMPHPERAVLKEHGSVDGLVLFENMIRYCCQT
ncbi:MAG: phosphoribosylformylglycinamidine synthase I [Firmicutes bacterium]|nr:phosphoribosylformylglycinamidine synthase I [Bacillota bacterium]